MASSLNLLFPLFLLFQVSLSLFLPLNKDPSTNHYLTRIYHGPGSKPATLILDLNSPFVYLDCSSYSNPITPLNCRSLQCTSATPNNCPNQSQPSDQIPPCSLPLHPLTGSPSSGHLVQTPVTFSQDDVISNTIDSFLFLCVPPGSLSGLPLGQNGVFGLGRTRIGAMSQIFHSFDHPKKFNLCLSPKLGMISTSNDKVNDEFLRSMVYTPILETGDSSSSYSITLKAVKLQNKKLPLENLSRVKISTIEPYTKVVTRVYREIIRAFITEAEALHMPRYPPRDGFELCYGVEGTSVVPVIDLVLQSEMVKWRIYGHNSMVKLNEEVMCLGVLDGGFDLGSGVSIVLGNHQLEDNLLEFDLGSSMLGFSSSLLKMGSSCAQLSLSSMNKAAGAGGGGGVQAL